MIVGVPKESLPGEQRVALIPDVVPPLTKAGLTVRIETGAGVAAGYPDEGFVARGAKLGSRDEVFAAEIVLQVNSPGNNPQTGAEDLSRLRRGQVVVGFSDPLGAPQRAREVASRGVSSLAMELIPRITRAQSMDALSSMATISGYKAVLLAANELPRIFPIMMTAAGTLLPAKVFVIGAGVAGLQALASAKRLGAKTEAYDVRAAVKEQVQSVGAKFVELSLDAGAAEDKDGYAVEQSSEFLRRQRALMAEVVARNDVVITTAAVPGKRAPILVTKEMVRSMQPGSVIVDLAADRGGNCELTRPGDTVTVEGVRILGPVNLPAQVPYHASQMYAKNVSSLLLYLVRNGKVQLETSDEITAAVLVTHEGNVVHSQVRALLGEGGVN